MSPSRTNIPRLCCSLWCAIALVGCVQTDHARDDGHAAAQTDTSSDQPASNDRIREAVGCANDRETTSYELDAEQSLLRVRVYRGGSLARLGHNHLIVAPLDGHVELTADRVTALRIRTLPEQWRIDDEHERAAAGAGFESRPDAEAVASTRRNMLSDALLAAARFPEILITGQSDVPGSTGASDAADLALALELELLGRRLPLALQLQVRETADGWQAHGNTRLAQHALGLTPFSTLGGALAVEDEIDVAIDVVLRGCALPPAP